MGIKPNFKNHLFFVFSPKIKVIEEGMYFLLKVVYEPLFFSDSYFNTARQKYQKIFKDIRLNNKSVSWYFKSTNNNNFFLIDCHLLILFAIKKINFNFCLKDYSLLQTILIDIYVHSLNKQFAN